MEAVLTSLGTYAHSVAQLYMSRERFADVAMRFLLNVKSTA